MQDFATRKAGTVTGTIDTRQLDQAGTLTVRDHHAVQRVARHHQLAACSKAVSWVGTLLMGRSSPVVRITGVSTDAIASMLISSVAGKQTVTVLGPCPGIG